MKTNPNEPAHPDPMRGAPQSYNNQAPEEHPAGLTKREIIAKDLMASLVIGIPHGDTEGMKRWAKLAVTGADYLIEELNQE